MRAGGALRAGIARCARRARSACVAGSACGSRCACGSCGSRCTGSAGRSCGSRRSRRACGSRRTGSARCARRACCARGSRRTGSACRACGSHCTGSARCARRACGSCGSRCTGSARRSRRACRARGSCRTGSACRSYAGEHNRGGKRIDVAGRASAADDLAIRVHEEDVAGGAGKAEGVARRSVHDDRIGELAAAAAEEAAAAGGLCFADQLGVARGRRPVGRLLVDVDRLIGLADVASGDGNRRGTGGVGGHSRGGNRGERKIGPTHGDADIGGKGPREVEREGRPVHRLDRDDVVRGVERRIFDAVGAETAEFDRADADIHAGNVSGEAAELRIGDAGRREVKCAVAREVDRVGAGDGPVERERGAVSDVEGQPAADVAEEVQRAAVRRHRARSAHIRRDCAEAGEIGPRTDRQTGSIGQRTILQVDHAIRDALGGAQRERAARVDFERLIDIADRDGRCIRLGAIDQEFGIRRRSDRQGGSVDIADEIQRAAIGRDRAASIDDGIDRSVA